ncbi:MAG: glycerophosphodiester phosphodiesterase family protein [Ilumatobacteraceae bacterium]
MGLPFGGTGGWPAGIAHRGGALLGPANSVEVLAAAAVAGADAVEIDVQELGDGSLVLFHDGSIVEGEQRYRLIDLDLAEFEALSGGRAVMLAELPERLVSLGLGLYLDVKRVTGPGLASLLDVIATSSVAERAVIGSFSVDTAAAVVADGRLPASVLYHDRNADPLALAASIGCSIVHPCFDSDPWMVARLAGDWMERVHEAGVSVVGWNVNDSALLQEMADAGFDLLCTDDPRLIDRDR